MIGGTNVVIDTQTVDLLPARSLTMSDQVQLPVKIIVLYSVYPSAPGIKLVGAGDTPENAMTL